MSHAHQRLDIQKPFRQHLKTFFYGGMSTCKETAACLRTLQHLVSDCCEQFKFNKMEEMMEPSNMTLTADINLQEMFWPQNSQ